MTRRVIASRPGGRPAYMAPIVRQRSPHPPMQEWLARKDKPGLWQRIFGRK